MVDDASACTSIVRLRSIYTCTRVRLPCMHGMRMPRVRKRAFCSVRRMKQICILSSSLFSIHFFSMKMNKRKFSISLARVS
jgi:hypothetical protein